MEMMKIDVEKTSGAEISVLGFPTSVAPFFILDCIIFSIFMKLMFLHEQD